MHGQMDESSQNDPQSGHAPDDVALTQKALRKTRRLLFDSMALLNRSKELQQAGDPREDPAAQDDDAHPRAPFGKS